MLPLLMSIMAGFAVYMGYMGIWRKRQEDASSSATQQRLRAFESQSRLGQELLEDDADGKSKSPVLGRFGSALSNLLLGGSDGSGVMQKIDEKLILSGRPYGWHAQDWVAFAFLLVGGSVVGGGLLVQTGIPPAIYLLLVVLAVVYSWWELNGRIKKRQEQARFELPYLLDELIMSLSSGAGSLDLTLRDVLAGDTATMGRTAEERVLVTEFRRAYQESSTQARSFAEAYRAAANRIQVQPVDDLVEVLVEGQSGGAPILNILRDMSRQVYIQYEQDVTTLIKKKDSTFTVATVIIMFGAAVVIGAPILHTVQQALSGGGQ